MFENITYDKLLRVYQNEKPFRGKNMKMYGETWPIPSGKRNPYRYIIPNDIHNGKPKSFFVCNQHAYVTDMTTLISKEEYQKIEITDKYNAWNYHRYGDEYAKYKYSINPIIKVDENNILEFLNSDYDQSERMFMENYLCSTMWDEINKMRYYTLVSNQSRKGGCVITTTSRQFNSTNENTKEFLATKGVKLDLNKQDYLVAPVGIKKTIDRKLLADRMEEYNDKIKVAKTFITSMDEEALVNILREYEDAEHTFMTEQKAQNKPRDIQGSRYVSYIYHLIDNDDIFMAIIGFAIAKRQISRWGRVEIKFELLESAFRNLIADRYGLYKTQEIDYANMTKLTTSTREIELSIA